MGMTYVKSDAVTAVAQASDAVEVDLGLGIDEAAKITGIALCVFIDDIYAPNNLLKIQAAYSFDPEDAVVAPTDDEQFAGLTLTVASLTAAVEPVMHSLSEFFDFSNMNLVTTRNLAFIITSLLGKGGAIGKVYYERFKPSAIDLSQLIAARR
ncbi:hypothetical protein ES708_34357 [subsurface metagenome]